VNTTPQAPGQWDGLPSRKIKNHSFKIRKKFDMQTLTTWDIFFYNHFIYKILRILEFR